jgi:hypothetical protein
LAAAGSEAWAESALAWAELLWHAVVESKAVAAISGIRKDFER